MGGICERTNERRGDDSKIYCLNACCLKILTETCEEVRK